MLKFGTIANSNMQKSVVVFTFLVLDWIHHFWENFVQTIKIVTLCENLVHKLI